MSGALHASGKQSRKAVAPKAVAAPPAFDKIVLVLSRLMVKARVTMKRIYTLIVLLGIVMGAVLTGCNQGSETPKPADTNAPTAASTTK
jgi:hypothetical protein